ncbi:MAG: ferric reductase-like transmembrane domain-containing protein [Pseudomonadota bacterium]
MAPARAVLIWAAVSVALVVPVAIAATSPQLAWREPVYIAAGFAGVVSLGLLLLQPLLAAGSLPGLPVRRGRKLHFWVGIALVTAVVIHVGGLWITSPPDVVDALLFRSPTPFSVWGVIAMWAVFVAAVLAAFRRRLRIRPQRWRLYHIALASIIVVGTVVHAMLIEGTMGTLSKAALCALVLAAAAKIILDLRSTILPARRKA